MINLATQLTFILSITLISITAYPENIQKDLPEKEKVLNEAKKLTSEKYKNSNSIIVNSYIKNTYKSNGKGEKLKETYIKILTKKGKENHRTLSFNYYLPYSKVKIKKLQIIKEDGTVRDINTEEHSKIAVNSSQMKSNIYNPNNKKNSINIPNLEVGDIIRYVYKKDLLKPRIPKNWSDKTIMENEMPIKNLKYEIKAPNKLPIKNKKILDQVKNSIKYSKEKTENYTTHIWEVNDAPRMFPEPRMPSLSSVVQRLLVTTIPSWEFISKWYWNLCKPHINATSPEMKKKVKSLIQGIENEKEKIKKIFYYVAQEIRYMGIIAEAKAPGFEPHDAKYTFGNKYGVCRDKAALLVSMLRLAGFDAYPVLIKVGAKLDKEIPLPYFNHAIACVERKNGKHLLMDPTPENTKDLFPAYLSNRSYLAAKPAGTKLKTSKVASPKKNLMKINTSAEINEEGTMFAELDIKFKGINDQLYRNLFINSSKEKIKIFIEKFLRNISSSTKLKDYKISPENLRDTSKDLSLKINYKSPNIITKNGSIAMLDLPWVGKTLGLVNRILKKAKLEERKYPYKTNFACGYNENFQISLNDSKYKSIELPKYKNNNSKNVLYSQSLEKKGNKLIGKNKFLLKVVEFSPDEYKKLKKILEKLESNRKKKPILEEGKYSSKNDIRILNKKEKIKLHDKTFWEKEINKHIKILTPKGKKDYADLKIPYYPAFEEVNLKNVKIIDNQGEEHSLSKEEINKMDAGWVSKAPRYPEEKILVANLPGIEVGAEVKYTIKRKIKELPFFSNIFSFKGFNPIDNLELELEVDNSINLNFKETNFTKIKETSSENKDIKKYKWSVNSQSALKQETSLPPKWTFLPSIIISSGKWEKYSKKLLKELNNASKKTKKIKKITKNLIKKKTTDKEKIIQIRDYVANNIRKAGPNFTTLPLNAISDVNKIIKDGYGNNADFAVVLASLLKNAGFNPEFVLVSDYSPIKSIVGPITNIPQRHLFDNILIRVKTKKNKNIFLNGGTEYSEFGSTPYEGKYALDIKTNKSFTIKPQKKKTNKIETTNNINLSKNGTALFKLKTLYYGSIYGGKNKKFSQMRPEERRRFYQKTIASISQSAEPVSKLKTNFDEYPGTKSFKIKIKDFAVNKKNYFYFTLPNSLQNIFEIGLDKRDHPIYMKKRLNFSSEIVLNTPKNTKPIIIPKDEYFSLPNESGYIERNIQKTSDDKWRQNIKVNIKPSIYSPAEFREIIYIQKLLMSSSFRTFLLKKNN